MPLRNNEVYLYTVNNWDVILAESSGVALIERGPWLYVVERGTGTLYTVAFVLGLLVPFLGIGGTAIFLATESFLAGGGIAILVISCVFGLWRTIRTIRLRGTLPLERLTVIVVFDRQRQVLCNAAGQPIAPLAGIILKRRMQLASSSRALHLYWPGGSMCLARGNPFGGGIGPIHARLQHALGMPH